MYGLFNAVLTVLGGRERADYEREKICRAAYAQDLVKRNIQYRQLEAAKFAAEHNCSIVIIDPDGTMRPG